MNRKAFWFFRSVFVVSAMLVLSLGYVQAQITGFIPVFVDDFGTEDASVIFQSDDGNIGIGTTTPAAKLQVAGGDVHLDNSSATAGNILKGGVPFIHNFGTNNTFLGQNAGNLTMTGFSNTASGFFALSSNTTGYHNTASGDAALQSNTTGIANTAIGVQALFRNTTGDVNTACGAGALVFNTTGRANTASGVNALQSNTTGNNNTANGRGALLSNSTGNHNTASGYFALFHNTTGSSNTASGLEALFRNTTGFNNTASGFLALESNTNGFDNTASGRGALANNVTGSGNTAIGSGANVSAGNLTNATAIGAGAIVDASNKIRLGNDDVTIVETSGKVMATRGFNGQCTTVFVPPGGGNISIVCNQDVAETFASLEATEPGDLVVLVSQATSMPAVRKSSRPYENLLVGVVSTSPGLVFDRGETLLAGDNSKLITSEKTVVGLVGRVPVKVSLESGPIAVGDPLTSSSTPGVAMKTTRASQIIGYAMEKADQEGKILVHLQPGYYIPPTLLGQLNEIDELKAQVSKLQDVLQTVLAQRPE